MLSLIFVVHTALLLGQGQLATYGIDSADEVRHCQNELFRTARLAQEADRDGRSLTGTQSNELERRIENACYGGHATRTDILGD